MKDYQKEFLAFAVEAGVLGFGEFTLKSGRVSPYFFNTGLFNSGERLRRIGDSYAAAIVDSGRRFDVLFGPAYKGIPLVSTAAVALAANHGRDLPFSFNRKEAKDHGEGGDIVGAPLRGDVAILDDVISAGTSIAESVEIIRSHGARPSAVYIALDRQERGRESPLSAAREVEQRYGMPVHAIATLDTLVEYLKGDPRHGGHLAALESYRKEYGAQ
ncbi:MAG TPA: orotate phosphoribosyltransferase [Arenicellales bacterium]|nr:orotate phosphoribosyltransferase [Arenicellales bacterium]